MITHVARAGENRGRVVLQLGCGEPSPAALNAAFRFARAFGSEIEGIFVEDRQLLELAAFSFVREVSFSGRQQRPLQRRQVERDLKLAAAAARRHIERMARACQVPMHFAVVRDDPVHALASACAASGPWNVVALAEPMRPENMLQVQRFFAARPDATGLVVVGPKARARKGPTVVVAEEVEHLPAMLRTAERLSMPDEEVILLILGESEEQLAVLEGQMRLALSAKTGNLRLAIAENSHGEPRVVAETLRRLRAGLVIGRYASRFLSAHHGMSDPRGLRVLTAVLECPLLLTT